MSSFIDTIKTYYEKIPRSYWAIISGIFGLSFIIVAALLHSITEPISFFTHWVSSLGWGSNGSEPVFRIGIIVLGCLLIPYIISLTRYLWKEREEDKSRSMKILLISAFVSSAVALVGLLFVSIFGNIAQEGFFLHLIGAVTFFAMTTVLMVLYTVAMMFCGIKSKMQQLCTLIVVIFFVSMVISATPVISNYTVLDVLNSFIIKTPGERVAFLASIVPLSTWLTFFEWMVTFSFCAWFIITGIYTLKIERA